MISLEDCLKGDLIVDPKLFKLMECKQCQTLDYMHILMLAKIYMEILCSYHSNGAAVCALNNKYFCDFFNKGKSQISSYLQRLESCGLIYRYSYNTNQYGLRERNIGINTVLINELLHDEIFDNKLNAPDWVIKGASAL